VLDLSHLNLPQRSAVTFDEGPALVLAGAGSGKTRVIAQRIAWLVERGTNPAGILAVTFTNKAAVEMRERVRALSREAAGRSLIATFHGFGLWLLRQEHVAAGLPRWFSICDAGDQASLAKRCLLEIQMDSRRFDVRKLLGIISRRKTAMPGASSDSRSRVPDDDYEAIADQLLPRYEQALRAQRSLDFDDLMVRPVALLAADRALRKEYRERFRHVLVDEFQDTNQPQLRLLELLCGGGAKSGVSGSPGSRSSRSSSSGAGRRAGHQAGNLAARHAVSRGEAPQTEWTGRSLCAVGDDDQAIYGWRGADVRNILRFEKHFPGATIVRLEQNYRSSGRILDCANGVISRSIARRPKRLWTDAGPGEMVRVVVLPDEQEEARFIAGEVGRRLAGGRRGSEFAVLYRLNAQSQPLEEAFREVGIPHKVKGGPAFFERAEVRDVLAWLKVCAFPDDDLSLARIVNAPPRGIGDVAMERLGDWAARQGIAVAAALRDADKVPDIPRGAPARMAQLANSLDLFRGRFGAGRIAEPARAMVEDLDLRTWLRRSVLSPEAGSRKAEAVDVILRSLAWSERRDPRGTLASYLQHLALDSRDEEPEEADGVTLTTLHSAKGLEFPVVFLIGVEEDLLPASGIQGEASDIEEERRLAYVGITRAREVLWVTRAAARTRRGRLEPRTPSRFLEDLPADAHVRHDPSSGESAAASSARSAEVLQALRARLGGRT
jgi:DNA helicase-2/ATP-dependent DNA helicase PcrA